MFMQQPTKREESKRPNMMGKDCAVESEAVTKVRVGNKIQAGSTAMTQLVKPLPVFDRSFLHPHRGRLPTPDAYALRRRDGA
jgi:hypothetical protein